MKRSARIIIAAAALAFFLPATGQQRVQQEKAAANKIFNFQFHFTPQIPGGDLAKRFGTMYAVGGGVLFKTKNNLVFSADGCYQFGYELKDNSLLVNLANSSGIISNTGGFEANVTVGMRGLQLFGKAGKLFPLSQHNRNSGVLLMGGVGFCSHMINIATLRNDIPTLTEDLKKGYDHLSMGPALSQTVAYYFHSYNRFINFYVGADFVQAFTTNVRGYNYNERAADTKTRFDMTYGLRLGWMIPIYLTTKEEDEFQFR